MPYDITVVRERRSVTSGSKQECFCRSSSYIMAWHHILDTIDTDQRERHHGRCSLAYPTPVVNTPRRESGPEDMV